VVSCGIVEWLNFSISIRIGSIATMSLDEIIPTSFSFSITGRCFISLLPITWIASWISLLGSMEVIILDMTMLTGVVRTFNPFATTFLAMSCSVMIPITESPSTIISELTLLWAIFWAHS